MERPDQLKSQPNQVRGTSVDPILTPEPSISATDQRSIGSVVQERFEIVALLGQGGMGTVYKAQDLSLGRAIALKILESHKRYNATDISRFEREARATARLDHPGIVKVYDSYLNSEPVCIAMELIAGSTLSDYIKECPQIEVDAVLHIFIEVTDALVHAHQQGLIHRDIKPSNIMLAIDSLFKMRPKLMDFGIAKLMDETSVDNPALTSTGQMIGSPLYMSPEQCKGKQLDVRSDIYSLGCTMYEALTGVPPFVADSSIGTMMAHLNDTPLSLREGSLGRTYPQALEALISKTMKKDPEERYQSVLEVHNDLRKIASSSMIEQHIVQSAKSVERQAMLSKILLGVSGIMLIMALGLAYFAIIKMSPAPVTPLQREKLGIETSSTELPNVFEPHSGSADKRAADVISHAKTQYVNLGDFTLSNDGLLPLLKTSTTSLRLDGDTLAPRTLSPLTQMKIRTLFLQGSNFNDEMAEVFQQTPSISKLELEEVSVTDKACSSIGKLHKLHRLVISKNKIGDHGIHLLLPLSGNLVELIMKALPVTDACVDDLAKFDALNLLDISGTKITAAGAQRLAKMKALRELSVSNMQPPWSKEDYATLRQAMPPRVDIFSDKDGMVPF